MTIETGTDWDGRWFIGFRKDCSMYFRDVKALRKFMTLPLKTASRESLDSWLSSLESMDQEKADGRKPKEELSQELLATGFGPECHLDESDPNFATRTII